MKTFIATAQVRKKDRMNVSEVPLCATSSVLFSLSRSHSHLLYNYYLEFLFKKYLLFEKFIHVYNSHSHPPLSLPYSSQTPLSHPPLPHSGWPICFITHWVQLVLSVCARTTKAAWAAYQGSKPWRKLTLPSRLSTVGSHLVRSQVSWVCFYKTFIPFNSMFPEPLDEERVFRSELGTPVS